MKISTLGRHFREGVKNIGRNGWMTVASVISVAITLLILGVFMLIAFNINFLTEKLENQVEIKAFVDLTAGEAELKQVEQALRRIDGIAEMIFVPKSEGMEAYIESMGEVGEHLREFAEEENNPLPDSYVIKAIEPREIAALAEQVGQIEHIYKVHYGSGTTETLFAVTSAIKNIGIVFIVGLAFTAMLLIANTIKITIVARRREIEIMKLVGATNGFIRWPFFVEGLLLGVIGASLPIVLLILGYQQVLREVDRFRAYLRLDAFELLPLYPLTYQLALILISIGAFIGIWGSLISVRRFLKV